MRPIWILMTGTLAADLNIFTLHTRGKSVRVCVGGRGFVFLKMPLPPTKLYIFYLFFCWGYPMTNEPNHPTPRLYDSYVRIPPHVPMTLPCYRYRASDDDDSWYLRWGALLNRVNVRQACQRRPSRRSERTTATVDMYVLAYCVFIRIAVSMLLTLDR